MLQWEYAETCGVNVLPLIADTDLQEYATLSEFTVYTTLNARNQLRAPTEFGLCLRPNKSEPVTPEPPRKNNANSNVLREMPKDSICFAVESEKTRVCWITAFRLTKVRFNFLLLLISTCY
jgi:hypothetical protein